MPSLKLCLLTSPGALKKLHHITNLQMLGKSPNESTMIMAAHLLFFSGFTGATRSNRQNIDYQIPFNEDPVPVQCPVCQQRTMSKTKHVAGGYTL